MSENPYPDLEREEVTYEGVTRTVFRGGEGPAVIVIHEVPGLYPEVVAFGRRLIDEGFTVYMPSLFGTPGKPFGALYTMGSLARACVSREFATWATGKTSPIVSWLRALAKDAHAACGGPGVGAVGMCLTGGFALAMMIDDVMVAPVLSQPSLPLPVTRAHCRDLGIDEATLVRVRERAAAGTPVLGLRFTGDRLVPAARFERLREELGDRFIAVEIDSGPDNPHGIPRDAHSVLTRHLVDEPGHPTRAALEQVIEFYRERLLQGPAAAAGAGPDRG
ncbi:MAG TPA: dienelactone hydrolase family protein [Kofleriaceae bacterium]|nr:dienelactone hydrolase family protein [Kofleriaceae bacterium]